MTERIHHAGNAGAGGFYYLRNDLGHLLCVQGQILAFASADAAKAHNKEYGLGGHPVYMPKVKHDA